MKTCIWAIKKFRAAIVENAGARGAATGKGDGLVKDDAAATARQALPPAPPRRHCANAHAHLAPLEGRPGSAPLTDLESVAIVA